MDLINIYKMIFSAICGAILFAFFVVITHSTYRDGQIDTLKKIHYHLVAQDNGTITWEK